jgi:phage terminase large subunit
LSLATAFQTPTIPDKTRLVKTKVFDKNILSGAKTVINRGSAGSSKSFSILQVVLTLMAKYRNLKILIVRKSLPSLRISTLLDFKEMISDMGLTPLFFEEKVNLNFYFNGNFLHFGSVDDPEKMKSTNWNYIFMEETNEFTYQEFQLVRLRLRSPLQGNSMNKLFMAFNPIDEYHWIKEKLIDVEKHDVGRIDEIHSTYKDNPCLEKDYIKMLEDLINQDANYHRIYAEGKWGKLTNLIYSNWDVVNVIPEGGQVLYGLDFGFNNPTALTKITVPPYDGRIPKEIYEEEMIYHRGMTNSDLIDKLQELKISNEHPIYADPSEPSKITEIRRAGYLIKSADNSVKDGIDFMKRIRVHILKTSTHLQKEKKAYTYKTDRRGNAIDEPVKFMDHGQDSERYPVYTHFKAGREPSIRIIN